MAEQKFYERLNNLLGDDIINHLGVDPSQNIATMLSRASSWIWGIFNRHDRLMEDIEQISVLLLKLERTETWFESKLAELKAKAQPLSPTDEKRLKNFSDSLKEHKEQYEERQDYLANTKSCLVDSFVTTAALSQLLKTV